MRRSLSLALGLLCVGVALHYYLDSLPGQVALYKLSPWHDSIGEDGFKRAFAARCARRPARCVALLDDRRARIAVIGAFGEIGAPAVPALTDALRSPSPLVRAGAAEALASIGAGAAPAAPALTTALGDSDAETRRWAADALGKIGAPPAAAAPLAKRLIDGDLDTRVAAVLAFEDNAAKGLSRPAVEALTAALFDENSDLKRHAAYALGDAGSSARSAAPTLLELAARRGWDPQARLAAANALGAVGAPRGAGPRLLAVLRDRTEAPPAREGCAYALGRVRPLPAGAYDALLAAAEDKDAGVRAGAARGLGAAGKADPRAVRLLAKLTADERWETADAASIALGALGRPAAAAAPALADEATRNGGQAGDDALIALDAVWNGQPPLDAARAAGLRRSIKYKGRMGPKAAMASLSRKLR